MPNWVRGVEAGSKIRTKINQKTRSTWEGIVVSIFGGFWWIFGGLHVDIGVFSVDTSVSVSDMSEYSLELSVVVVSHFVSFEVIFGFFFVRLRFRFDFK